MSTALTTYAHDISDLHQKAQQHAGMAIQCAIEAGQKLIEAKSQVRHGGWLGFLDTAGVEPRTAQRYMKVAEASKNDTLSHLSMTAALEDMREIRENKLIPAIGEYLQGSDILRNADVWVWPYNDEYFHFLLMASFGKDEGGFLQSMRKPMKWDALETVLPDLNKMEKTTGDISIAMSLRDLCLTGEMSMSGVESA